jgi:nucleoside-diphosphate-sugar epimerase
MAATAAPKSIVAGATGYIGRLLFEQAANTMVTLGTSSSGTNGLFPFRLDAVTSFDYGLILPGCVVFLTAAISAPDVCARENGRAWAVNVTGTSEFIDKVMSRGGRVVFFSSDTVYGERRDAFDETAKSNPAGGYAEMKAEVEKRFFGNSLFKSIRLSYVFSREDKFTKYLSGCAERGEEAELFHPFYRAIVHRNDVVEGALTLAQRWDEFPQQVINFGGPEVLSRIDFAECLQRNALPSLRFLVTEPGDEFFKNRPRVIAMSSAILPRLLGRPSRTMAEAARVEFLQS